MLTLFNKCHLILEDSCTIVVESVCTLLQYLAHHRHHHAVGRDAKRVLPSLDYYSLLSLCCESDVHESVVMSLSLRFRLMVSLNWRRDKGWPESVLNPLLCIAVVELTTERLVQDNIIRKLMNAGDLAMMGDVVADLQEQQKDTTGRVKRWDLQDWKIVWIRWRYCGRGGGDSVRPFCFVFLFLYRVICGYGNTDLEINMKITAGDYSWGNVEVVTGDGRISRKLHEFHLYYIGVREWLRNLGIDRENTREGAGLW